MRGGHYARDSAFTNFDASARQSYMDDYLLENGVAHEQDSRPSKAWHAGTVGRILEDVTRREELAPMTMAFKEGRIHFPPNKWYQDCLFYLCNNHILLSICFAHPAHPFSRNRRLLVLGNSLSFAFFITCVVRGLFGFDQLAESLASVLSAVFQLAWDIPGSMLGSCVCANMAVLPVWLRHGCGYASLICLSCHLLLGLFYAAAGALLLVVIPWVSVENVSRVTSPTDTFPHSNA